MELRYNSPSARGEFENLKLNTQASGNSMPPAALSNSNSYLRLLFMVLADDSTEFSEIVGNEDAQTPFASLKDRSLHDEVSDLLEVLDDRERKIIFHRFGLADGKPKTLRSSRQKVWAYPRANPSDPEYRLTEIAW
jgi:hypothetical protein